MRSQETVVELWNVLLKPLPTIELGSSVISRMGVRNFTSFHWRFEESVCQGNLGLCFRTRQPTRKSKFSVPMKKLVNQILQIIDGRPLFLSTDGRERGKAAMVEEFKAALNETAIVYELHDFFGNLTVTQASEVEQYICTQSETHVGSSMSTWDWEVFYLKFAQVRESHLLSAVAHLENPSPDFVKLFSKSAAVRFIDEVLRRS